MTEYGKFIRTIRKERNENLMTMASKLNVSVAFLSALEVGKKQIPLNYAKKIQEIYNLNEYDYKELQEAIMMTNKRVLISLDNLNNDQQNVSIAFARQINTASQKTLDELRKILEDGEKDADTVQDRSNKH